jgi:3D (Asp-Asp-Asp) domain-containing protein
VKIKIAIFLIYISFFTSISIYFQSTSKCNKAFKVKTTNNFSLSSSRAKCTPKCTPKVTNTPKHISNISRGSKPTHKVESKNVVVIHKDKHINKKTSQYVNKPTIKREIKTTNNIVSTPKPVSKIQHVQNTVQNSMIFTVTAYDLSVESCGKSRSNPEFGITSSGYSLAGKSRIEAMTIAADINILPYGTRVYMSFDSEYARYNGTYTVRDTGGAIKGHKIDLFMGDGSYNEMDAFGVHRARVRIIK